MGYFKEINIKRNKKDFNETVEYAVESADWRAPEYNQILLVKDIKEQFNVSHSGLIDHSAFYVDPLGASNWCDISKSSRYTSNFSNMVMSWPDWASQLILSHLKDTFFDKDKIEIIGLGCGDGQKEIDLCAGLAQAHHFKKLHCYLLDISPALLTDAHAAFINTFSGKPHITSSWVLGNFYNLPRYKELFFDPASQNTLKIGTLFDVFGNIRHEVEFIAHSLNTFKTGDLVLVEFCQTFADWDKPEIIMKEDPSVGSNDGLDWLTGVLKRNRPQAEKIRYDFKVQNGLSTIPKSYTIEILATIDEKTTLSMYRKHRYDANELIKIFKNLGWKPLSGQPHGYKQKVLTYLFAKN